MEILKICQFISKNFAAGKNVIQKNILWEQERKNKRRKTMRAMGRSLRSMDSPTASDLVKRGNGRLRADPVAERLPGFILLSVDFRDYL